MCHVQCGRVLAQILMSFSYIEHGDRTLEALFLVSSCNCVKFESALASNLEIKTVTLIIE